MALSRLPIVSSAHHHAHAPDELWLASTWPFVREHLPPAPARVLELGCGPLGGFVPAMRTAGYEANGVDPEAPDEPGYHRATFEEHELDEPLAAIVACTSLHHVADVNDVLDRVHDALAPGGTLVVIEWAHERVDEQTARWCFDRLASTGRDDAAGWMQRHRDGWHESGRPWTEYFAAWVADEGMHAGRDILAALNARFEPVSLAEGPYFYADLDHVTREQEQAAIDAGDIQATGIRYVGRRALEA
jgi:SAM-dependent methyltransferase